MQHRNRALSSLYYKLYAPQFVIEIAKSVLFIHLFFYNVIDQLACLFIPSFASDIANTFYSLKTSTDCLMSHGSDAMRSNHFKASRALVFPIQLKTRFGNKAQGIIRDRL